MKKWDQPCSICNGQSANHCVICGHKISVLARAEKTGHRDRIEFLTKLSEGSLRGGNSSTYSPETDKLIEEHREFTREIYVKVRLEGQSPTSVAEEYDLTKNMILRIVHHELTRELNNCPNKPNPPTKQNPPPPKPILTGRATFSKMDKMY